MFYGVFFQTPEYFSARKELIHGKQCRSHGANFPSVGKSHHRKDRNHGRDYHVYDHGLYPRRQPFYHEYHRHGQGGRPHCHCPGRLSGHHAHGRFCQLPLCPGTGHGTQCFLCLHCGKADGLFLGNGTGCGLCGRDHLHRPVPHQCA